MVLLNIVRSVKCPKLRGDLAPIVYCYGCAFFGSESGRTVICGYVFVPVGEAYGKEEAS